MKQRKKRAALSAAMIYLTLTGFSFGLLKAAQTTRRLLYGGAPVMAHLTRQTPGQDVLELGGGEWKILLPAAENDFSRFRFAEHLPPCMTEAVLRLLFLTDRLSAQTAEWIGTTVSACACSR